MLYSLRNKDVERGHQEFNESPNTILWKICIFKRSLIYFTEGYLIPLVEMVIQMSWSVYQIFKSLITNQLFYHLISIHFSSNKIAVNCR